MAQIGEILAELREENNWTQGYLAELFHVSVSSISAYEIGKRPPSIDVLVAYARQFNVSTDYILGLTRSTEPLSVFSDEYVPGKTIGDLIQDMKKLRPEQREALLVILRDMHLYAEISKKTDMSGDRNK